MKYLLIILLVYVISNAETTDKIREVVDIPFKEASMINSHTEFMGVTIYAKTIDEDTQENYFYAKSIKETLLYPGDTILGFMFFDEKQANKNGNINMKIQFMNSLKKYDLKTKVFE